MPAADPSQPALPGCCTDEGFCGGYEGQLPLGCNYGTGRGKPCSGNVDAGAADAGTRDGGTVDAAAAEAGVPSDAGRDAGTAPNDAGNAGAVDAGGRDASANTAADASMDASR